MLKMELAEYKKFHREVLFGNPSSIFQFLVIDKGKIRFRTLEEEQ
jgi:cell shape-determining protein MreC